MTYHYTFSIGNLTLESRLSFRNMSFPNKESHRVFFLILFFILKKAKISGESKIFSKKSNFQKKKKKFSLFE